MVMAEGLRSDRALVVLQNDEFKLAAHFFWFESQPEETFNLVTDNGVCLELDSRFPVRPRTIYAPKQSIAVRSIGKYIGKELADYLPGVDGLSLVTAALDSKARFAIAEAQALSENTPDLVREACINMVMEHSNV